MKDALGAIADGVPEEIYHKLNGGIILSPETKIHPKSVGKELVINGEYHNEPYGMGRYIILYYGSLMRSYGHLSDEKLMKKVKEVLYHELIHHLESMAGDRSLERSDAEFLDNYLRKRKQK
jgi:predicted Zn-dependent protease with MMP-like domain